MSDTCMVKCRCCGSHSFHIEEVNLNYTWKDHFCPTCAKQLKEEAAKAYEKLSYSDVSNPGTYETQKLLSLFLQHNAACIPDPIDTIEDNDGTEIQYFLWVEPDREEDAVRIVDEKSTEWGDAEDVGDVTLIECIEEGLHGAGIRYVIEEVPTPKEGIPVLPEEDSGERYVLLETVDREISEPVFFKTMEMAKYVMLARLAQTMDRSIYDLIADLQKYPDFLPDDWEYHATSAFASNRNHAVVDWQIFTIDISTI